MQISVSTAIEWVFLKSLPVPTQAEQEREMFNLCGRKGYDNDNDDRFDNSDSSAELIETS